MTASVSLGLLVIGCGRREGGPPTASSNDKTATVAKETPAKPAAPKAPAKPAGPTTTAPKPKPDPVERVIHDLEFSESIARYYLLKRLEKPQLNPDLAAAHANPTLRSRIAQAILKLVERTDGEGSGVLHVWVTPEQLSGLLEFMKPAARKNTGDIIKALGEIKDPRSVEAIAPYFPSKRDVVSRAFQKLGAELCSQAVLAFFNYPDGGPRGEARRLSAYFRTKQDAILDQTLRDLKAEEPSRRYWTCDWLLKLDLKEPRRTEMARALEPVITDINGDVRRKALAALLRLADADTVPCLVKYLNDPKNNVDRKNVVLYLGRCKDSRAVVAVVRELNTDNYSAAREAVKQMGSMAEKEVCKFLEQSSAAMRSDAARLLEVIGTQDSAAALKKALNDKHPTVKSSAKKALERISERAK